MLKKLAFSAVVAALLSGCASVTQVQSSISEFHSLRAPSPEDSIVVLPWRKDLEGSLEFQTYASQVASGLLTRGYTVVAPPNPAKYSLFLDYGIDQGRTETASYSIPQFGLTGYSGATTTGTISTFGNTSYLNARTTATPQYGVTGYKHGVISSRVYRRFVHVDIVELTQGSGNPKKVYEGRLQSEGECGALPVIMPTLIQAFLVRFPGESGKQRIEVLPFTPPDC